MVTLALIYAATGQSNVSCGHRAPRHDALVLVLVHKGLELLPACAHQFSHLRKGTNRIKFVTCIFDAKSNDNV